MKNSLIVCTYMRPEPLLTLLNSVKEQTLYPDEILIVDGSTNNETANMLKQHRFKNLSYYLVDAKSRGLTRQRNFGIAKVDSSIEVICFLDDDIVLTNTYFEVLLNTYQVHPKALAVGGYISNQVTWTKSDSKNNVNKFHYDGWMRVEPLRFRIRRLFGLLPESPPGKLSMYSHGRSVGFLPPSKKVYEVEQIMGGASSYRKSIFEEIGFSNYFEGYGLYEDVDFSYRISCLGKLYLNTNAQLSHYHDPGGRPNQYKYGRMVVRNGWYVWRLKNNRPKFVHRIKWYAISVILILVRCINIFQPKQSYKAFTDVLGRCSGLMSLLFSKPKNNFT